MYILKWRMLAVERYVRALSTSVQWDAVHSTATHAVDKELSLSSRWCFSLRHKRRRILGKWEVSCLLFVIVGTYFVISSLSSSWNVRRVVLVISLVRIKLDWTVWVYLKPCMCSSSQKSLKHSQGRRMDLIVSNLLCVIMGSYNSCCQVTLGWYTILKCFFMLESVWLWNLSFNDTGWLFLLMIVSSRLLLCVIRKFTIAEDAVLDVGLRGSGWSVELALNWNFNTEILLECVSTMGEGSFVFTGSDYCVVWVFLG